VGESSEGADYKGARRYLIQRGHYIGVIILMLYW